MRTSLQWIAVVVATFVMPFALEAQQPTVRVAPLALSGPRPLQKQTAAAAIRDYLESWQHLRAAFAQNNAELLGRDFVGTARDKLTETVGQQAALGIHSQYLDRSHDLRIVFYSPEGLSIQLIDDVTYDQQLFDATKLLITQRVRARYVVVLTPAENRWQVRILETAAR